MYNIDVLYQNRKWVAILKDSNQQIAPALEFNTHKEVLNLTESSFKLFKQQINEATGYSFNDLVANTRKVIATSMFKIGAGYKFENTKANYLAKFKYVSFDTTTYNPESHKHYKTSIFFYNVNEGEEPDLNKNPVRVSCSCGAYYYYFSYWNMIHGTHARRPLKPYVRKTPPPPEGLPERNPSHLPGLCKHLMAFGNYLDSGDYDFGDFVSGQKITPPFEPTYTGIDKLSDTELLNQIQKIRKEQP